MKCFVLFGFTRCGTTSLYDTLESLERYSVTVTHLKQCDYLLKREGCTLDGYLGEFKDPAAEYLFDISPDYESDPMLVKANLDLINLNYVPILMTRPPFERYVSWLHHIATLSSKDVGLVSLSDYKPYLRRTFKYDAYISNYFDIGDVIFIELSNYTSDISALLKIDNVLIQENKSNSGGNLKSLAINRLIRWIRKGFRLILGKQKLPKGLGRISNYIRALNYSKYSLEEFKARYQKEIECE